MKKIKFTFRSSQTVMYAIGRRAWVNYFTNLAAFTAFNAKYTEAYEQNAEKELENAASLPNSTQRQSNTKSLNRKTKSAGARVRKQFKILKRYIINAFPADQVEPMLEAAGSTYYLSSGTNFIDLAELAKMALAFIIANGEILAKDGNGMPASFIEIFTSAKAAFDKQLEAYNAALTGSQQGTSAKGLANEIVYNTMMGMMNDGKEIFAEDADLIKQFTYSELEKLEKKNHNTGLHILVREPGTLLPVTTASFLFQPGNITASADAKGIAKIKLKEGIVSGTVTAPGYASLELNNIKITTGVMHRLEVTLNKEAISA